MPFGDFLQKYNLQSLAYIVYSYQQGLANVLAQTTLYLIRFFDRKYNIYISPSEKIKNCLEREEASISQYLSLYMQCNKSKTLQTRPSW